MPLSDEDIKKIGALLDERLRPTEENLLGLSGVVKGLESRVSDIEMAQRAVDSISGGVRNASIGHDSIRDHRRQLSPYTVNATHKDVIRIPSWSK